MEERDMREKTRITENSNVWDAKTGAPVSKSRRSFMANAGMYGAGLAGSALLGACSDSDSFAQDNNGGGPNTVVINGPSDQAVLNFALNLEYLEAEYYLRALTGSGLRDADRGMNPGTVLVKDNPMVTFTDGPTGLIARYAAEIAADELSHVQFLRKALGSGAVAAPQINLQSSFNAAASAAGLGGQFRSVRQRDQLSDWRLHIRGRRRDRLQGRLAVHPQPHVPGSGRRPALGRGLSRRFGAHRTRGAR
jgi:hypothetical protein